MLSSSHMDSDSDERFQSSSPPPPRPSPPSIISEELLAEIDACSMTDGDGKYTTETIDYSLDPETRSDEQHVSDDLEDVDSDNSVTRRLWGPAYRRRKVTGPYGTWYVGWRPGHEKDYITGIKEDLYKENGTFLRTYLEALIHLFARSSHGEGLDGARERGGSASPERERLSARVLS